MSYENANQVDDADHGRWNTKRTTQGHTSIILSLETLTIRMNLSTVVSLMVVLHALLLCWVANASLSSYQRKRKGHHPSQRDIMIKNLSGGTIDMFWINPETRELTASNFDGGLVYGGESGLNSYIGHSFEVREIPSKRTGKCKMTICRKAYLTVNANEEQST